MVLSSGNFNFSSPYAVIARIGLDGIGSQNQCSFGVHSIAECNCDSICLQPLLLLLLLMVLSSGKFGSSSPYAVIVRIGLDRIGSQNQCSFGVHSIAECMRDSMG